MKYIKSFINLCVFSLLIFSSSFAQEADDNLQSTGSYCPNLSTTFFRGATDRSTNGQVTELQKFLMDYYDWTPTTLQVGTFDRTTQRVVIGFQKEQGLPSFGTVGSLTRTAIAKVCSGGNTQLNTSTNTPAYSFGDTSKYTQKIVISDTQTILINLDKIPNRIIEELVKAGKISNAKIFLEYVEENSSVKKSIGDGFNLQTDIDVKNYLKNLDNTKKYKIIGTLSYQTNSFTCDPQYTGECRALYAGYDKMFSSVFNTTNKIQVESDWFYINKNKSSTSTQIFNDTILGINVQDGYTQGQNYNISWQYLSGIPLQTILSTYPEAVGQIIAYNDDSNLGIATTIVKNLNKDQILSGSTTWTVGNYTNDGRAIPSGKYTIIMNIIVPVNSSQSNAIAGGKSNSFNIVTNTINTQASCQSNQLLISGACAASTLIKSNTTANLYQANNNYYLSSKLASTIPVLSYQNKIVTAGQFIDWSPIGAAFVGENYLVAWKNKDGTYSVWIVDPATGKHIGNITDVNNKNNQNILSSNNPDLIKYETTFGQDLNGDGTVGPISSCPANQTLVSGTCLPHIMIKQNSSANLKLVDNKNYYLESIHNPTLAILSYQGVNVTVGQFQPFSPVGAAFVGGNYLVAWKNTSNTYSLWKTTDTGAYINNILSSVPANSLDLINYEKTFEQDLNGDGTVGPVSGSVLGAKTYCPKLTTNLERGATDNGSNGQVTELQKFLVNYFSIDESSFVTGFFGENTKKYLSSFQSSNNLSATGYLGELTREKIKNSCN